MRKNSNRIDKYLLDIYASKDLDSEYAFLMDEMDYQLRRQNRLRDQIARLEKKLVACYKASSTKDGLSETGLNSVYSMAEYCADTLVNLMDQLQDAEDCIEKVKKALRDVNDKIIERDQSLEMQ